MNRKNAFASLAALAGSLAASPALLASAQSSSGTTATVPNRGKPVHPPAHGPVNVGFVIGPDLVEIDLFGPLAAFGSAFLGKTMNMDAPPLFNTYTIAESTQPLDVDGMKVQAQYSFANAPQPNVLVVPMQRSLSSSIAYVKSASKKADITMSICTGAFLVAKAGLFDGLEVTTHHDAYDALQKAYPKLIVIRGPRYVENLNVSSSGGLSSGIDLSLRVIERYYGPQAARNAAYNLEYRRSPRPQNIDEV